MLTDAVRKLHTGGTKAEFPWVIVGLAIPAIQILVFVGALVSSWFGH